MQSISTNILFMHGHEKWGGGKQHCLPPTRKSEGAVALLAPTVPWSMITLPGRLDYGINLLNSSAFTYCYDVANSLKSYLH